MKNGRRFRVTLIVVAALLLTVALYWSGTRFSPKLPGENKVTTVVCEEIYTDLRAAQEDFLKAGKQVCGLDLSGRRMPTLTRGVSFITSLTYLDVSDNNFKELPEEISALKKLKVLNLQGNPLPAGEVDKVRKLLPNADVKF